MKDADACTNCGGDFQDGPHTLRTIKGEEVLCKRCWDVDSEKRGAFDGAPIDGGWGGYTPRPMHEALFDSAREISDLQRSLARVRREALEEAARVAESGRFLHDEAPAARLGREVAAAIRSLASTPDAEGGT